VKHARLAAITLVLSILSFALAPRAAAQDPYGDVVRQIFESGQHQGELTHLTFLDGDLRQYAVAEGLGPDYLVSLYFIEEMWFKDGDNDVIEQWIIHLMPYREDSHLRITEKNSTVLSTESLATDGSEAVVRRILERVRQKGRRAGLFLPDVLPVRE